MGWQVVYVPFLFAGDTIIEAAGIFTYSSTPTLGNLIASIAPQAGVDDFGNVYQQGITSYLTLAGTTYAVGLNTLSGTGLPGLSIEDIAHLPASPAGFFGESSSAVATPQAFAAITSGQANGPDIASFISILSQVQSAVNGGQIVLQAGDIQFDVNGNLVDWSVGAAGNPLFTTTTGDGNTYKVGSITQQLAADFPVVTTSAAQIPGLIFNVGAATYRITGFLRSVAAAAGIAQPMTFQLHSSATASRIAIATNAYVEQGNTTTNPGAISAFATSPSVITGNVPNNTVVDHVFDGFITFTSGGQLGLFANQVTSAADETFTIQSSGRSWWRLEQQ